MKRIWTALLFGLTCVLTVAACSGPRTVSVQGEVQHGDREREWAVVYFLSWRKEHNGDYLKLSRQHMSSAIQAYLKIQVKIGHSYPDFYDIDKKRVQGCDFLREIDRDADRFGVALHDRSRSGCFN